MLLDKLVDKVATILVIIILSGGMTAYAESGEQLLSLKIKPVTNTIISGGPCTLDVTFTNNTASEIVLVNVGFDIENGLYFEILDSKGKLIVSSSKIPRRGGMGIGSKPKITIQPDGTIEEKHVLLNQWCSTLLPEGKYTIVSHFESITTTRVPLLLKLTSTAQIEILPSNKQNRKKLQDIFSDLLNKALADTDETPITAVEEKMLACEQLAYATSPMVVSYLTKLLLSGKIPGTGLTMEVIEGFRRVGTVEAAKELVSFAKEDKKTEELLTNMVKQKIIIEIFHLQDISKDPEVIETCKSITTTMPRPKEQKIVD